MQEDTTTTFHPNSPDVYAEPFSRHDRRYLAQWAVRDRILLLCLTGLYVKITSHKEEAGLWEDWVIEYEKQRVGSLRRPFPPVELENLGSHNERKRPLGQALRITTQTLDVYWHRQKKLLRQLECIQDACVGGP